MNLCVALPSLDSIIVKRLVIDTPSKYLLLLLITAAERPAGKKTESPIICQAELRGARCRPTKINDIHSLLTIDKSIIYCIIHKRHSKI